MHDQDEFYEARTHFSELLDQVAKGKTILITRPGKPAAILGPPPSAEKDVKQVVREMLEYRDRQKRTLGGISIRELIEEGRHMVARLFLPFPRLLGHQLPAGNHARRQPQHQHPLQSHCGPLPSRSEPHQGVSVSSRIVALELADRGRCPGPAPAASSPAAPAKVKSSVANASRTK